MKVGDILVSSWGWSATIISYYEVVKTTKCFVWVKELKYEMNEMADVMPILGKYREDKIHKCKLHTDHDNYIIVEEIKCARVWDGKSRRYYES